MMRDFGRGGGTIRTRNRGVEVCTVMGKECRGCGLEGVMPF